MNLTHYETSVYLRQKIRRCSDKDHVQQVAYSTHHDGITQICFTCEEVNTSIEETQ
jgi:hypothetical protein